MKDTQNKRFNFAHEQWRHIHLYLALTPLTSGIPDKPQHNNQISLALVVNRGGPSWAAI
jgi:hypothetical protein